MKRIIIIFMIMILSLHEVSFTAFAEELLPGVSLATVTSQVTNVLDVPDDEFESLQGKIIQDAAIKGLTKSSDPSLNQKKAARKVRDLVRKTFRANEKIPVTIENDDADKVSVEVFNADGIKVEVRVEEVSIEEPAQLLVFPPIQFKPGRYRLKITDSGGGVTTQDFTWGVLAINTNKSIYQPGDTARLHMAVLDETGNMVCDAKVTLSIKDPSGNNSDFSTDAKTIKVNPECFKKEYTLIPDYEADFSVGGTGKYEMKLTAETKNGTFSIMDSFEVREKVAFDVERDTNTRIFPPVKYPVKISITAEQDFEGEISEIVPEHFQITPLQDFLPFDAISTNSANVYGEKKEQPSFSMAKPFALDFKMTQGFGEDETDPVLAAKYKKYGVVGHDGMDYALPSGTKVLTVDDGVVVRAAENGDYGTTVVVQHSWGKSYYGHLSQIAKPEGTQVKRGDEIGLSGNTGLSTGPHLHFGIKLNQNDPENGYYGKINPEPYFGNVVQVEVAQVATSAAVLRNIVPRGTQVITWNVKVKKGDKINIGYSYLAPLESPQFYTLGPLEFTRAPKVLGENTENDGTFQNDYEVVFRETRRWQIASDAVANNGTIVYGNGGVDNDNLNFRTYTDPTTVGAEATTVNTADTNNITFSKIVASPTRDEKISVQLNATGQMFVLKCTGGCDATGDWSQIGVYTTTTTDANAENMMAYDIAYEQLSGRFMIVFTDDNDVGDIYYCLYDGTSWTPTTECNGAAFAPGAGNQIDLEGVGVTGQPEWIRLKPRTERLSQYRGDEMLLGVSDSNDDMFLAHWTGSAWEDQSNPVDDLTATNARKFDIAWEETTGQGLAVFSDDSAANLRYSIYDGSSWGAAQTDGPANNGGQAYSAWVEMASDPLSDDIAIGTLDSGSDTEIFVWTGAAFTEGTDDTSSDDVVGKNIAVQWTRFTQRAIWLYTDSNALTSDMECWTSGGGFAVVGDVGSTDVSNSDDVEDIVLVGSPNNNRMNATRNDIDDAMTGLTYSATTGCADGDWVTLTELNASIEGHADGASGTVQLAHGSAYTAYSPWSRNWRFFDDETSDNPSVGLNGAGENTTPTGVDGEEVIRLRMNMSEASGMTQSDTRKILQYTTGSVSCTPDSVENDTDCTWTDVGDTSETSAVFRYATAGESCSACTDGNTSNTPSLTGTTTGDPEVFYVADKNAATDTDFDHTALTVKEIDFPLKVENASSNTTYYFRLYEPRISSNGQDSPVYREQDNDGANDCATATCTYPSLTTGTIVTGPTLEQTMRHGKWFNSGVEAAFTF